MELLERGLSDYAGLKKDAGLEELEAIYAGLTKGDAELNAMLEEVELTEEQQERVKGVSKGAA